MSRGGYRRRRSGLYVPAAGAGVTGYAPNVLADGPLAAWKFEDTSGSSAADYSGNAHPGTINGAPTLGAATVMPSGAGSFTLDTAAKHVNAPVAAWLNQASFTIEGWVRLTNTTSYHNIFNRDGTLNRGWNVYLKDGQISCFDGVTDHVGSAVLATNAVGYIAVTCDSSTVKAYLNGVLDFSFTAINGWASNAGSAAGTNSFVNDLSIGASLSGGSYSLPLVGDIDYVAYYGSVLSATRIAAHYAAA